MKIIRFIRDHLHLTPPAATATVSVARPLEERLEELAQKIGADRAIITENRVVCDFSHNGDAMENFLALANTINAGSTVYVSRSWAEQFLRERGGRGAVPVR